MYISLSRVRLDAAISRVSQSGRGGESYGTRSLAGPDIVEGIADKIKIPGLLNY